MENIAIMGMGFVGLTLGVALAKKGFNIYGVEKNSKVLESLENGEPHFTEKGLAPLLKHYVASGKIKLYEHLPQEEQIDAYIVSVGTPLDKETKGPNTGYIKQVLKDVGEHIQPGGLVVLRSTVAVGTSRNIAIPDIEHYSSLKAGEGFSFAFAPERTIEGNAILELEKNPQVIGGFDTDSAHKAAKIFSILTPTILTVSNLESAEMVKLMDNSYRDVRFSYANQIALICEQMELDASELIKVANTHYPRNSIPMPSPGVGGACLSKDPYILADAASNFGLNASLVLEGRKINEDIVISIVDRITSTLKVQGKDPNSATISIAGFAFKGEPETSDLRESTTLWFLDALRQKLPGAQVVGYDAVVSGEELEKLGIRVAHSIQSLARGSDVIMLMNNHPSYLEIDPYEIRELMNKPSIFYDSWRMLEKSIFEEIDDVIYMGVGL